MSWDTSSACSSRFALPLSFNWRAAGTRFVTFLLKNLTKIARRNGIRGLTAEVLRGNKAMQAVFNKSGCQVKSKLNDDVYSYELGFE